MTCLHFGCTRKAGDTWSEHHCELHAPVGMRRPALRLVEPRIYEDEEEELDLVGVTAMDVAGGFVLIIAIMVLGVLLV